jgi:hypothetical protein
MILHNLHAFKKALKIKNMDISWGISTQYKALKSRIRNIRSKVRTTYPSVFSKSEVIYELDRLFWFQLIKLATTLQLYLK